MANNPYIPIVSVYEDLERLQFSKNLRSDPQQYSAYVQERVQTLTDEVFNRKRAAFQKAHIDLARYMDMDHNANFYKARSGDVDRLTDGIGANNERIKQTLARDKDVSRRQFEINEWYNYNKLETLFFLQVFFIVSLLMAIIIFLQKNGTLTGSMSGLLTTLLFLVVAGLGVYRYYYTRRIRDTRLWHRRYFERTTPPPPPPRCSPDGQVNLDINDVLPKEVTECADQAVGNFNKWSEKLQNSITDYQTAGTPPKSIFGEGESATGLICDQLNTNAQ
jgi:hypothetical protein